MSPRPRTIDDAEILAATARVIERVGPGNLTLARVAQEGRVVFTGPFISGLELYDAIRLDRLDKKWDIDGAVLLSKIRAITDHERLMRGVAGIWERNEERSEADLEALEE